MGTLRSAIDHAGITLNGVTLGEPIVVDDGLEFRWSDPLLPDGVIETDGNVVIDEVSNGV